MSQKKVVTRCVGTKSAGIRAPIVRPGDDLATIVVDSVFQAVKTSEITMLKEKDIIGITESIAAKAQGNFASLEVITEDFRRKYKGAKEIGIVFPILSRNRYSKILEAIAMAFEKVYILLSYPCDEVGNYLISLEKFYESGIGKDRVYTAKEMYEIFGSLKHEITGVDYVELYQEICGERAEILFANNASAILNYSTNVLASDIHTRHNTKKVLKEAGAEMVYGLDDIMTESINGSGYNPEYGLLGSNMSSEDSLKLFPRDCQQLVNKIQKEVLTKHGAHVEVLVYGDGAYKDPSSKIWELADPVVSPGYTSGLAGSPNEIKLKYVADNELADMSQEEAQENLKKMIGEKTDNQAKKALGTTPREYSSLIGSLCDLISGSGDKGTPIVVVQNYFDNYADS